MFSVGQRVWHRDGKRSGKVLECEGDRVFIEQDNGAELDFRASDLSATPPPGAPRPGAAPQGAAPLGTASRDDRSAVYAAPVYKMVNRTLTAADITPEHEKVLAIIPVRTVQAVAALFERRPKAGRFSALGTAEKLNLIADVTGVPYRTMREHRDRPGELGLMMGKGLADAQRGG
jgi:hypothetical protein